MRVNLEIPAGSVEYIRTTITSESDLSSFSVEAALAVVDTLEENLVWSAAEWSGDDIRWLYSGNLAPGVYEFWVRILGVGETPVRRSGLVRLLP